MARPRSFTPIGVAIFRRQVHTLSSLKTTPTHIRPRQLRSRRGQSGFGSLAAILLVSGLTACGSEKTTIAPSVQPTQQEQAFARYTADPATVKRIPLGTAAAAVRSQLGRPAETAQRSAKVKPTKNAKAVDTPYTVWIYGVKGAGTESRIELSFIDDKLKAVLAATPTNKPAAPGSTVPATP